MTQPGPTSESATTDRAVKRQVQERMRELFRAFERRSLTQFTYLLDDDFMGASNPTGGQLDRLGLESALDTELSQRDSIEFEYFVDRIIRDERAVEVQFHWDRRWRNVDTGNETRRSGETTFRFVDRDGDFYLQQIRGRNPFL